MSKEQMTETGEFMLFGVRVVVDSMRKSVSLNNLSQYQHHIDNNGSNEIKDFVVGYVSADESLRHSSTNTTTNTAINRERKRGVPWTEEEHKLFLLGLQKVGKGDWRGISRIYVKTRTPTQVASHAQKYFLRRSNLNRRRRRSSLFDITTDSVSTNSPKDQMRNESPIEGVRNQQQQQATLMQTNSDEIPNVKFTISQSPIYHSITTSQVPAPTTTNNNGSILDFNLNTNTNTNTNTSALSLNLSLSMSTETVNATLPRNPGFLGMITVG